jgi:hypothetical protein
MDLYFSFSPQKELRGICKPLFNMGDDNLSICIDFVQSVLEFFVQDEDALNRSTAQD